MPKRNHITTFTGLQVDLSAPTPEMICIEDIAHHLSMLCRWAGATKSFFSVAQHSVLVSKICPWELQKWALLHDAAEAYIGDLTRPLKVLLRQMDPDSPGSFDMIETGLMRAIAEKFNLGWPEPPTLAEFDDQIQRVEAELFMLHDGQFLSREGTMTKIATLGTQQAITPAYLVPNAPSEAETMFLWRYKKIFHDEDGL